MIDQPASPDVESAHDRKVRRLIDPGRMIPAGQVIGMIVVLSGDLIKKLPAAVTEYESDRSIDGDRSAIGPYTKGESPRAHPRQIDNQSPKI
jgi:hypothetical protein